MNVMKALVIRQVVVIRANNELNRVHEQAITHVTRRQIRHNETPQGIDQRGPVVHGVPMLLIEKKDLLSLNDKKLTQPFSASSIRFRQARCVRSASPIHHC